MNDTDYRIYDAPPSDEYIKGYCVVVFCALNDRMLRDIRAVLDDKRVNTYAYIPTRYAQDPSIDISCEVCYFMFASKFEFKVGRFVLAQKRLNVQKLRKTPVYFHKSWICKNYDPKMYNDDAKRYRRFFIYKGYSELFSDGPILDEFSKKEIRRMRKCYAKKARTCYHHTPDSEVCTNSVLDDPEKNCKKCPLSHAADRYDSQGRCIKRLRDIKKDVV